MSAKRLWEYAGPIAATLTPFLLFFSQQGIREGSWWDEGKDPAILLTVLVAVAAAAYGGESFIRTRTEPRKALERDIERETERTVRRAFGPINRHLPEVPITHLGVHVWRVDGDHLTRFVTYTMEQR